MGNPHSQRGRTTVTVEPGGDHWGSCRTPTGFLVFHLTNGFGGEAQAAATCRGASRGMFRLLTYRIHTACSPNELSPLC